MTSLNNTKAQQRESERERARETETETETEGGRESRERESESVCVRESRARVTSRDNTLKHNTPLSIVLSGADILSVIYPF